MECARGTLVENLELAGWKTHHSYFLPFTYVTFPLHLQDTMLSALLSLLSLVAAGPLKTSFPSAGAGEIQEAFRNIKIWSFSG